MKRNQIIPYRAITNPVITTLALPNARQGTPYGSIMAATGGRPPYTWAIAGSLNLGLAFNTVSGLLSGTPVNIEVDSLTFTVTDLNGRQAIIILSLTTVASGSPIITTTSPLPNGIQGAAYSTTLAASGGTPGYTWAKIAGTLDVGLSLNGATGVISGTPVNAEVDSITIQVTDSLGGTGTQVFSLTVAASGSANLLMGANQQTIGYFDPSRPFLNIFKSSGSSPGFGVIDGSAGLAQGLASPWLTETSGQSITKEMGYLQLDANGYVTSMTASPIPAGGQQYGHYYCYLNTYGSNTAPGAVSPYEYGVYRMRGQGAGIFQIGGDASAGVVISSGSAGLVTVSGTTFTSNSTSGTWEINVTISGGTGTACKFTVSSTDPLASGNYLRNFSLVHTLHTALYDAGEIYHPFFLAMNANIGSIRFMKFDNTEQKEQSFNFAAPPTGTSATIAPNAGTGIWLEKTLVTKLVFGSGETRDATFTLGSNVVTWTGALTGVSGTKAWYGPHSAWSQRSLPNDCFYTGPNGVPIEMAIALCNKLGANYFGHNPLSSLLGANASLLDLTYVTNHNNLVRSTLNSNLSATFELCNETWNGGYNNVLMFWTLGVGMWPLAPNAAPPAPDQFILNRNYYGMCCALIAQQMQIDWGTDFNRCYPAIGWQFGNSGVLTSAMDTAYWFTYQGKRASDATYPIKVSLGAIYFGNINRYPSQSDTDFITGSGAFPPVRTLAQQLTDFFSTRFTNVVRGTTLTSMPALGYLGEVESAINAAIIASNNYSAGKPLGFSFASYEGGPNFLRSGAPPTGYVPLCTAANRDSRMGDDVRTVLNYWAANVGVGPNHTFHYLVLCQEISGAAPSGWGAAESSMQVFAPLSDPNIPAKWGGIQRFILGLP